LQQQLLLGFDPEGDTGIGSHRVGWAGEWSRYIFSWAGPKRTAVQQDWKRAS
jgi:hypothetical protein